jgi:hypothetical protein
MAIDHLLLARGTPRHAGVLADARNLFRKGQASNGGRELVAVGLMV